MLSDQTLEEELRLHFHDATNELVADDRLVHRVIRRARLRRVFKLTGAAAGAAVVAGAVLILTSLTRPDQGTSIHLASYSFPLPHGYHATSSMSYGCRFSVVAIPGLLTPSPYSNMNLSSAASNHGGCIAMLLSPSYNLTQSGSDPYELPGAGSVAVGSYAGWATSFQTLMDKTVVEVGVRVPMSNGAYHDVIVGAIGLSQQTLTALLEQGLSS